MRTLFHIHRWGRWQLVDVRRKGILDEDWYDGVVQQRECETCGRVKRAEVWS